MRLLFGLLIFLFSIYTLNCQTPKGTPTVLVPSVEQYHSLTNSSGVLVKYFKITIDKKIDDEDLLIMARPVEDISDPDIFISQKNEYPDSYANSELICSSNGLDVCTIPQNNITDGSTFYIGIKCYTQCSFAIKATYDVEQFFALQEDPNSETLSGVYNIQFETTDAKIVKFYIPKNDKKYERVLTEVHQIHTNKINESFYMYMNEGNNPPTSSRFHLKGIEAWNFGQCVLITDLSDLWSASNFANFSTSDVNYTLMIQAPAGSNLQIVVNAYNDKRKAKLHQNLQDMVYIDHTITYELIIDDTSEAGSKFPNTNLLLTLTAFAGNPDLYVNPDTLPKDLKSYRWKSNEEGKESLIITPKERQIAGASDKRFYVTVVGKLTSTFSLWIGTSYAFNYLTFGVSQTGAIENEEIINYRLFVFSDEEMNVTTTLNTETGNPDLYVKLCILNDSETDWRMARQERLKCLITADDIANRYKKIPDGADFFLFSDNVGGKDAISFRHDPEKCFRTEVNDFRANFVNKCMYVVGVHGNCNWQNESEFSLVVTHSQQHIILIENTPQRNKMDLGEVNYFQFTLYDQKDIENVNFHVTEISGRVTTYISKTNRYPDEKSYDRMSYSHWGSLVFTLDDSKDKANKSLTGTYYLAIKAETSATYSVLTSIKRNSQKEEQSQRITLGEGVPQYYSFLYDPNEKHYFRFRTKFINDSDVMIHLTPIRGEFRLYVLNLRKTDLLYPTKKDFHFVLEPSESTLLIRKTSEFYTRRAHYLILVEPITDAATTENNLYELVIQYSTSDSMRTLSSHNPLKESVQNNTYSYYRCEAHKGDESIEISINVQTYNPFYKTMLQVFFSFQSAHPFPDESFNEFNTTVQNNIWILVENSDLKTNCPYLFENNLNYAKQCVFYMSIKAFESDSPEIQYSVQTKRNFIKQEEIINFMYLTDNSPITIQVKEKNNKIEPLYFLYKLENGKRPLHITAFTSLFLYGESFVVFGEFHPLANITKDSLKSYFPKNDSNGTSSFFADSSWHHSVSLTIYQEKFKNLDCFSTNEGCGFFISVYMSNQLEYNYINSYTRNVTFTMQVTRRLIVLHPGVPYKGFVMDEEIKYFRLTLDQNKTTILISVTPLNDGDPDLIVNRGANREWPDLHNYDYGSKDSKADQLSILHDVGYTIENNTYIIGVYGRKNCSFVLTATYGDYHLVNIYAGGPTGFLLKPREKVYLKYYNLYNEDEFRIIFSKDYGKFFFAITALNETEDFIEKMPNFKDNYYWTNLDYPELDHINIDKNQKNYCKNCTYVILVQAETECDLRILVAGSNQTVYLQNSQSFKDFVKEKKNNTYSTYFYDVVEKISVNILVYQGKVKAYLYNNTYQTNNTTPLSIKTNEFSNKIKLEYEPENSSYWFYAMVTVVIEGTTSSNYTIVVHADNKPRYIRYGIPEYGELNSFSKSNFLFYSNVEDSEDHYYGVTLRYYTNNTEGNFTGNSSINKTYFLENTTKLNISISILVRNEKNESVNPVVFSYQSEGQIYARFKAIKGNYVILVDNSKNSVGFPYTLVLSFSGLNLIYNDMDYANYLTLRKSHFYQLMVGGTKKVLVELFQCFGKNRIYVASNHNSILNYQSDLKTLIETSSSNHITYLYDTKNLNEIFIAVKSIEGGAMFFNNSLEGEKNSRYLLRTHYVESQTPYEVFYPGNDGKMFFYKDGNSIGFTMKRLTCEKECRTVVNSDLKKSIEYYKYTLRIHYDVAYLEESMTCFQLYNGSSNEFYVSKELETAYMADYTRAAFEQLPELTFFMNLNDFTYKKRVPYYAKVVAQVFIKEDNVIRPYSFYYKTIEFYPDMFGVVTTESEGGSGLLWILMIVLVALIGALIAAYVFFKKYKKTENQLNYEMQDVTKIARVDDINRKDYIGLINETKA